MRSTPSRRTLNVEIPAELYERLVYTSRLPRHQDHGGTFEALVIRALEDGLIGIAVAYERFEDEKPITNALHALVSRKSKTRMDAGSKGKRLIHRR